MVKTVQRPATIEMTTSFRENQLAFNKYQTALDKKKKLHLKKKTVMKL
jgi:hypothetical protein